MTLPHRPAGRLGRAAELLLLAAVAYPPLLLSSPGMVAADTKQYLYLDPGRLLASALSMWNPAVAGGGVTHQNIGYLLPQGPFYYVLIVWLHSPPWVAQRLWMGSLLLLAGTGVRYLARVLGFGGPAVTVAALVYELSPYVMQYIERISALLMPWAALGWLVGFTVVALRRGGWRYPALFALVAAAAGGTNATSIIYVGIAPAAWIVFAWTTGEVPGRRALAATGRILLLTAATGLWWISGLWVEGAYGIDVLRYSETLPAIASSSVASEVVRGLGYWDFYGSGRLGPWLASAVDYESPLLLVTSFALPTLAVLSAALTRWREKAYFLALGVLGLVFAVGLHPYRDPSLSGAALKAFMTSSTAGMALRSSDRATPLLVLALAMFLGAGAGALAERAPRGGYATAGVVCALAAVNAAPLLSGAAIARDFERPSALPHYELAAARYLDAQGNTTRVLVEPGQNFADYTFGDTIDPVWPGLLTRPEIQRQQLIDGSYATADLLGALDRRIQEHTYEPSMLAPVARLLSAGDVLWQSNLAFWRYGTPIPKGGWEQMYPPPRGIGNPARFGRRLRNVAPPWYRALDGSLQLPPGRPWPPALAVFPVSRARPIYRAESAGAPLVIDGSGAGIVDAAATGLLDSNPTIAYAGSLDHNRAMRSQVLGRRAVLVLTDTNRKVLDRFESEADNVGETLPVHPGPSESDPTQVPLDIFGHQGPRSESVAQYSGAVYVSASSYGGFGSQLPGDRPYMAFDGNPANFWLTSPSADALGQWIQVKLDKPVRADHVRLSQILRPTANRWITAVTLSFDGAGEVRARLEEPSRTSSGQVVSFPTRTFRTLRIRIDKTSHHGRKMRGVSGVGFSEVRIPGVRPLSEWIRLPSDLLAMAGRSSLAHRLVVVLTRRRSAPYPVATSPEPVMARRFSLPTARTFSLSGSATISPVASDPAVDRLLGGPSSLSGDVFSSSSRLPGDLRARAASAFDASTTTAWSPAIGYRNQLGSWVQAKLKSPISFDHMRLVLLADGRHSVPTELRITSNTGGDDLVPVPPVRDRRRVGAVVSVPLSFGRLHGSTFRFEVTALRRVETPRHDGSKPVTLPVGIAEMGVPGIHVTAERPAARIPARCLSDLLSVDGHPVWLRVSGSVKAAESLGRLAVRGCGPDAHGLHLAAGRHSLLTAPGSRTGFAVNQLVLDSAAGGRAEPVLPGGRVPPAPSGSVAPQVRVLSSSATSATLRVSGSPAHHGFWLVLGESFDRGWSAATPAASLGHPVLLDGYANGWYLDPRSSAPVTVTLSFAPQRVVDWALGASALGLLACLVLLVLPSRAPSYPFAEISPAGGAASSPEQRRRQSPRGRLAAALAGWLGVGAFAAALAALILPRPAALPGALALGVLSAAAQRWRGARWCLALAAPCLLAAGGGYVLAYQLTYHVVANIGWPTNFDPAGTMVTFGLLCLVALATAERAASPPRRERRGSARSRAPR